jgi:predicted nucleotidyltransferase
MKIQKRYQEAVDEFMKRVLEKYRDRIESIILFGSVARGVAKEEDEFERNKNFSFLKNIVSEGVKVV